MALFDGFEECFLFFLKNIAINIKKFAKSTLQL